MTRGAVANLTEIVALAMTAAAEDALTFEFGPPIPVKPAHELYAEFLLASGRPKEAREQFEKALARAPRRALAMQGLAKAAEQNGDPAAAQQAREDFKAFWRGDSTQ